MDTRNKETCIYGDGIFLWEEIWNDRLSKTDIFVNDHWTGRNVQASSLKNLTLMIIRYEHGQEVSVKRHECFPSQITWRNGYEKAETTGCRSGSQWRRIGLGSGVWYSPIFSIMEAGKKHSMKKRLNNIQSDPGTTKYNKTLKSKARSACHRSGRKFLDNRFTWQGSRSLRVSQLFISL